MGSFERLRELLVDALPVNVHWHLADEVGWRTPYDLGTGRGHNSNQYSAYDGKEEVLFRKGDLVLPKGRKELNNLILVSQS
jgi:hypothetical protein